MGFFLVLKAEVVRSFIIMRRYWFATLTGLFVGYGFLIMLIYAFLYNKEAVTRMADSAINGSLGFVIGVFAFGILGIFTQGLQGMARTGELEQLCMSPHGLISNFMARSLVAAITTTISLSILLTMIALSVGGKLHADPFPIATLLVLTYASLIGFGFMSGGLVLVFKQTGQIAVLFRLGLVGLATMATTTDLLQTPGPLANIIHVLPAIDAAVCLKYVLVDGGGMGVFAHPSFFWLLFHCVFWTITGLWLFHYMENLSRDRGTLGSY